jgi:hypothetical protein
MAKLANTLLLQITSLIDPRDKDLNPFTVENVGIDEGRFTAQERLDIYNKSRLTITGSLLKKFPLAKNSLVELISGNVEYGETITFESGSADKPDGYIFAVDLMDSSKNQVTVLSFKDYRMVKDLERATNLFVFEVGDTLKAPPGSSLITSGSYTLTYYKILPFTLADINEATVNETYNDEWHPLIEEIAVLIANEVSDFDISNTIEKFFLQQTQKG